MPSNPVTRTSRGHLYPFRRSTETAAIAIESFAQIIAPGTRPSSTSF